MPVTAVTHFIHRHGSLVAIHLEFLGSNTHRTYTRKHSCDKHLHFSTKLATAATRLVILHPLSCCYMYKSLSSTVPLMSNKIQVWISLFHCCCVLGILVILFLWVSSKWPQQQDCSALGCCRHRKQHAVANTAQASMPPTGEGRPWQTEGLRQVFTRDQLLECASLSEEAHNTTAQFLPIHRTMYIAGTHSCLHVLQPTFWL